jgi:stage III sporulation protein SpoIIIAA
MYTTDSLDSLICFGTLFLFTFYRMTLLLGPPSSGRTTLLLALAGKLDSNLRVK